MPDPECDVLAPDDVWLGSVLIATWALHTGRTLRRDVPCGALPADELIAFWADPMLDSPLTGPDDPAHAAPGPFDAGYSFQDRQFAER